MTFTEYPGHIVALLSVSIVAAILVWAFRGSEMRRHPRVGIVLFLCNAVILLLLLLICWNPSRSGFVETAIPNRLLVYFDTSQSMSINEPGGQSRLDRAVASWQEFLAATSRDFPTVEMYGFDGAPYSSRNAEGLIRWGSASNLLLALETARERAQRDSDEIVVNDTVTGLVVFTDGQADNKILAEYPVFNTPDFPVSVIGVGATKDVPDWAITRLALPPRCLVGKSYTVEVSISGNAASLQENPVLLQLSRNGLPTAERAVTPAMLEAGKVPPFSILPDILGTDRIEVSLVSASEDINPANNIRYGTIAIVPEPKVKVLFYTQWLSPDIGHLRQALSQEKMVDLEFVMDARKTARGNQANRAPLVEQQQFPDAMEDLFRYDMIVLGPCAEESFSREQIQGIYDFVARRGGSLIVLPGRSGFDLAQAETEAFRTLFPFEVQNGGKSPPPNNARPVISTRAKHMQIFSNERFARFPNYVRPQYDGREKPAAAALLSMGEQPVISVHAVGRGQTALLNLRNFHLLYDENQDGGDLSVLVSGLIRYLGGGAHDASRLELYAERLDTGKLYFTAHVYDRMYAPAENAKTLLTVQGQTFRMNPKSPGVFEVTLESMATDNILAHLEAAENGAMLAARDFSLHLPGKRSEMDTIVSDHAFLKALADHTGAFYYTLDTLPEDWMSDLSATTLAMTEQGSHSVWRTWPIFIGLCGILILNWFIRRLAGML